MTNCLPVPSPHRMTSFSSSVHLSLKNGPSKILVKRQMTFTVNRHVQNLTWNTRTLRKDSHDVYTQLRFRWRARVSFTHPGNLLLGRNTEKGHRLHLIWDGRERKLLWTFVAALRAEWAQICTISVRTIMKARPRVRCPFFCPWFCFHLWLDDSISEFY